MKQQEEQFRGMQERIDQIKVISAEEDKGYSGNRATVILEVPVDNKAYTNDYEQFFRMDEVKRLAIREAEKVLNKQSGWSDISRLHYFKDDNPCSPTDSPASVRVNIVCLAMP